jgi:hypothetical protein
MQSSESSFIVASTGLNTEVGSESYESLFSESGEASMGGSVFAMFHLDYLSCFLTILATILLARKSWIGLLVAIVNSLIVCAIGLRTSQLGFIPANLFCICVYAFSMRPWLKEQIHPNREQALRQDSRSPADGARRRPAMRHRTAAGTRCFRNDLGRSIAIKTAVDGFIYEGVGLEKSIISSDDPRFLKRATELQS